MLALVASNQQSDMRKKQMDCNMRQKGSEDFWGQVPASSIHGKHRAHVEPSATNQNPWPQPMHCHSASQLVSVLLLGSLRMISNYHMVPGHHESSWLGVLANSDISSFSDGQVPAQPRSWASETAQLEHGESPLRRCENAEQHPSHL